MMKELKELVRPNIQHLAPYSSARSEFSGKPAKVFLDANESPYNTPFNRYPDPLQFELKAKLSQIKGIHPDCIFLGNGSDEAIDLLFRVFCIPGRDNVVSIEPSYGMYEVCANVNDIEFRRALLTDDFLLEAENVLALCNDRTKLVFLCSPNNPTGNALKREEILKIMDNFGGIVVVDEAYIDFSSQPSLLKVLATHPNLVILQTLSKAWASAAIRLGMAFAVPEIIAYFNKVKYPYNVNYLTQKQALEALKRKFDVEQWVKQLLAERTKVIKALSELPFFEKAFPSDANFVLVKVSNAQAIYDYLVDKGVIVRNRTHVNLCENCLRITIGFSNENNELIRALRSYQ